MAHMQNYSEFILKSKHFSEGGAISYNFVCADVYLDRPGCSVSQSTDGVTLYLFAQFVQHVNFVWSCIARH